jgi:hypothetical protein
VKPDIATISSVEVYTILGAMYGFLLGEDFRRTSISETYEQLKKIKLS